MTAVDIDIHSHIGDIDSLEDYLSARRIFKTIETAKECALTASGGSDYGYTLAFFDLDIDAVENIELSEALMKINYFYHFCAVSFP